MHIEAMKKILGLDDKQFISFIVFGNECDFKKVSVNVPNTYMMKWVALPSKLQAIIGSEDRKFEGTQVNEMLEKLRTYSHATDDVKQKHIDDIKKQLSR